MCVGRGWWQMRLQGLAKAESQTTLLGYANEYLFIPECIWELWSLYFCLYFLNCVVAC